LKSGEFGSFSPWQNPLHRSKPYIFSSQNLVKFHQRRKHWMKLALVFKGIGSEFFCENIETKELLSKSRTKQHWFEL
jgi:hypothetical protein